MIQLDQYFSDGLKPPTRNHHPSVGPLKHLTIDEASEGLHLGRLSLLEARQSFMPNSSGHHLGFIHQPGYQSPPGL